MTTDRSRKILVRNRMAATGKPYTSAARDVDTIRGLMPELDCDYAGAEAWLDDPRNELLCETCGWTKGMVCPECAKGCGCEWRCSGWRHGEYGEPGDDPMADDDCDDYGCPECGAGNPYEECMCLT